jgi:hypothetical protein
MKNYNHFAARRSNETILFVRGTCSHSRPMYPEGHSFSFYPPFLRLTPLTQSRVLYRPVLDLCIT